MDKKDFNTKEGIAARLGSYAEAREMLEARRNYVAGIEVMPFRAWTVDADDYPPIGSMPLEAFYILGSICTDQNGQVVRLNPQVFDEARRAKMPAVMTENEFLEFADAEGIEFGSLFAPRPDYGADGIEYVIDVCGLPPPPGTACMCCEQEWSLDSLGDHLIADIIAGAAIEDKEGDRTFRQMIADLRPRFGDTRDWIVKGPTRDGMVSVLNDEEAALPERTAAFQPCVTLDDAIHDDDSLQFACRGHLHRSCLESFRIRQAQKEDAP